MIYKYLFWDFNLIFLQNDKLVMKWWYLCFSIRQISLQVLQQCYTVAQVLQILWWSTQRFGVGLHKLVQLRQFGYSHLLEDPREAILPFVAVAKDGEFERRWVQQDELDVDNGLLLLDVIGDFSVPVVGRMREMKESVKGQLKVKVN